MYEQTKLRLFETGFCADVFGSQGLSAHNFHDRFLSADGVACWSREPSKSFSERPFNLGVDQDRSTVCYLDSSRDY